MKVKKSGVFCSIVMLAIFCCCCGSNKSNFVRETEEYFETELTVLSSNAHIYNNELYVDYVLQSGEYSWWNGSSRYTRLVINEVDGKLKIVDTMEIPSSWDRMTQGYENFLVSGDCYKKELWIYNLETEKTEDIHVENGESIVSWKVKNGILYYCVLDESDNQGIVIYERTLSNKQVNLLYENKQMTNVLFMDINEAGEVGLIYTSGMTYEHRLGIVCNNQLKELNMQNVEVWNQDKIQHYEFHFIDDKFMICTEDVSRTLPLDSRISSYKVDMDGQCKFIPCKLGQYTFLGYIDEFYDLGSHYLAYWNKLTYSEDGGKAIVCTFAGEVCGEVDSLWADKVLLLSGDDMVYLLSITGQEVENITFQWEKMEIK